MRPLLNGGTLGGRTRFSPIHVPSTTPVPIPRGDPDSVLREEGPARSVDPVRRWPYLPGDRRIPWLRHLCRGRQTVASPHWCAGRGARRTTRTLVLGWVEPGPVRGEAGANISIRLLGPIGLGRLESKALYFACRLPEPTTFAHPVMTAAQLGSLADRTTKHASVCLTHPVTSAAQQAVEAVGCASSCISPPPSRRYRLLEIGTFFSPCAMRLSSALRNHGS
jgi:hypothetical protein